MLSQIQLIRHLLSNLYPLDSFVKKNIIADVSCVLSHELVAIAALNNTCDITDDVDICMLPTAIPLFCFDVLLSFVR